ncbi:NAD(P)-binding domain-containing protein [Mobilicoccus massiliensis]|uniref:NAD(P)-binding domain-containing protein n=1 Tax=Mobilicoccus massiliensis TaxID=1522310 RepID=UPI0009E64E59|nr:NAD(P)-binding domain-containing protein [Mobilicoccus massiliensis]
MESSRHGNRHESDPHEGRVTLPTVGFVGVGKIAAAMVDGLADACPRILLSPRGRETAADLAARHPNVEVCESNHAVVDGAEVLVIAVRPDQVDEALRPLDVSPGTLVVSVVAGVPHETFTDLLGDVTVVRSIPLPSVRHHAGRTLVLPDQPQVRAIFDHLGGTVAVETAAAFDALQTTSATMTTLLHYLATVVDWAAEQGVPPAEAEAFVQGAALGTLSEAAAGTTFAQIADGHETPGGLNEQVRTTWLDPRRDALRATLDEVLRRVRGE